jgi:hypothetical protein
LHRQARAEALAARDRELRRLLVALQVNVEAALRVLDSAGVVMKIIISIAGIGLGFWLEQARAALPTANLGPGKLFRRTGDQGKAQEHLTKATSMYHEMDMAFWLQKAEAGSGRLI